jgi:excisionase family DNA binding protein
MVCIVCDTVYNGGMEHKFEHQRPFFSTQETATLGGVTSAYIRYLLLNGTLHGYKAGRNWVLSRGEVERWLESRGDVLDLSRLEEGV